MFSHISVGVSDFERSYRFYRAVMDALGLEERFIERDRPWAGWHSAGQSRPYFTIGAPFDGNPHAAGNGQMMAFMARDRSTVKTVYEIAIGLGAVCEGPPGLRPEYHANYYGAYFRDYDGNKLCVACHEAEG